MKSFDISRGAIVEANGHRYSITNAAVGFDQIEGRNLETGRFERLAIESLQEPREEVCAQIVPDLSTIDSPTMQEARRRVAVVQRLLTLPRRTKKDIDEALLELGVGKTTLYRWMFLYRCDNRLTSLMPVKPNGGRKKSRLNPEVERVVQTAIETHHLTASQPSVRSTMREIKRMCRAAGLKPPHENTVRFRIDSIPEHTRLKRRGHGKTADDKYTPRPGHYDEATCPLAVVQVDHTPLDVVLVDEKYRLPLSRPWLTLAFDVYSRMVLGFYISFDTPGALGTGLCIARSILPKEAWLARFGVKTPWPCWGFPAKIQVDNAREFRGEMLRLACEQYGISIDFRPVASPSTGGHIERYLGTLMLKRIHDLPGVALKPGIRGDYDAEANAALTLQELEESLLLFFTGEYHQEFHTGIGSSPIKRWTDAILGDGESAGVGLFPRPADEERLYLDFMPVVERTVQTYGVQIDEIRYYSDALRPYIGVRGKGNRSYVFRRDPRDISTIYFWDPALDQHLPIPYRNVTHPAISVWELRAVRNHLESLGKAAIDEDLIFATYERLREHQERAQALTKRTRRQNERRAGLSRHPIRPKTPAAGAEPNSPRRFEKIELLEMEEM